MTVNQTSAKNVVVSTRVRLARNITGLPFPEKIKSSDVADIPAAAALHAADFPCDLIPMKSLSEIERLALMERHLISMDLVKRAQTGALLLSRDETVAVMVNEEDHIRAQCILKGANLEKCYNTINDYDDRLSGLVPLAFDIRLGYLTACITNVGTGMRSSAMLFLPALTFTDNMGAYIQAATRAGITVRGVYGESSNPQGCMYQISNTRSLGLSEQDIINEVSLVVNQLSAIEQELRDELYASDKLALEDKIYRAYGVLQNARALTSGEFMELITLVKLGIALNIINFSNMSPLDEMMVMAQPANLCRHFGREELSPADRDVIRARYVRETLKNLA